MAGNTAPPSRGTEPRLTGFPRLFAAATVSIGLAKPLVLWWTERMSQPTSGARDGGTGPAGERATQPAGASAWAWAAVLLLPALALALLLARPDLDLIWEHHPSHFWLVLAAAAINVALAYLTNEAATRRNDARLFLISLAFLASAGFLGLHALATPGVLLPEPNAGFVVATPVGLAIASVFAAVSISPLAGPRAGTVLRHRTALWRGLVALMIGWAVVSLTGLPPLDGPLPLAEAAGPLAVLAVVAVGLYVVSAWRYWKLYRARGSMLALAVAAALVLLAEAMLAVAFSRNWHLSWWEWHVLMTAAFAAIALGARAEYRRTRSLTAAFGGIYLEATLARIDRWHARAISDLAALQAQGRPIEPVLADLRRDGASTDEIQLLTDAAGELRRVDELFRPYLPAQLAERLRVDPEAGRLGGVERDVTVLFADLTGFTTFSETREPTDVLRMLNRYWATVVPIIDRSGGLIEQFAGDGIMAIFNAVAEQPDHAWRAATAALSVVRDTDPVAEEAAWPRFRIGVNTGPAVIGNVGAEGRRSFGAIGDTTNLGSRLMSAGEAGQVVVSGTTRTELERLGASLDATPLGAIAVKGKRLPVEAWVLHAADRR